MNEDRCLVSFPEICPKCGNKITFDGAKAKPIWEHDNTKTSIIFSTSQCSHCNTTVKFTVEVREDISYSGPF